MRISIADLVMLLELVKRRSTDVALTVALDGHETRFTFGDVDGQIITATLYSTEHSNRIARVTKTENLPVMLATLKAKV